ncbi:MAG: peptidoglycan editing factor PgeF [Elainellaceae cyanobacterium]
MSNWQWQTWQGRPYLTCGLLSAWKHGFFTRHWSPELPEAINASLAPEAEVYRLKQVHGDRVLAADQIKPCDLSATEPIISPADGIVAREPQQSIWVATADCVPALIGDRRTGRVAAVHAGWRGTAQRIVPQAVSKLLHQGAQRQDLRVALGPAIAGDVYQVSTAVAARVGATLVAAAPDIDAISVAPPRADSADEAASSESIDAVLHRLTALPRSPISSDPAPDRVRLDVRQVNHLQLEQMGLTAAQIAIAPCCTYRDDDAFFSYRRESLKKIQWSGIVSL